MTTAARPARGIGPANSIRNPSSKKRLLEMSKKKSRKPSDVDAARKAAIEKCLKRLKEHPEEAAEIAGQSFGAQLFGKALADAPSKATSIFDLLFGARFELEDDKGRKREVPLVSPEGQDLLDGIAKRHPNAAGFISGLFQGATAAAMYEQMAELGKKHAQEAAEAKAKGEDLRYTHVGCGGTYSAEEPCSKCEATGMFKTCTKLAGRCGRPFGHTKPCATRAQLRLSKGHL